MQHPQSPGRGLLPILYAILNLHLSLFPSLQLRFSLQGWNCCSPLCIQAELKWRFLRLNRLRAAGIIHLNPASNELSQGEQVLQCGADKQPQASNLYTYLNYFLFPSYQYQQDLASICLPFGIQIVHVCVCQAVLQNV